LDLVFEYPLTWQQRTIPPLIWTYDAVVVVRLVFLQCTTSTVR